MRVSSRNLQAVRRGEMLARYALMGPVAFVHVDLPPAGTVGSGLDDACLTDHHGIVIRGEFTVHFDDGRPSDTFGAGAAFYVPPGPPTHHFTSTGKTRVAGFSAVAPDLDLGPDALDRMNLKLVPNPATSLNLPATVRVEGGGTSFRRRGSVDVEGSVMGRWLFMRSILGPQSGYTSTWCELPHWGLVLYGDMTINYHDDVEFVSAGDAFYAPAGHRFESSEGATIIDYTPLSELDGRRTMPAWRRQAVDKLVGQATVGAVPKGAPAVDAAVDEPIPEPTRIVHEPRSPRPTLAFGG